MHYCEYTPIDIALYIIQKMTPEEEKQFRDHLSLCEECRTTLSHIEYSVKKRRTEREKNERNIKKIKGRRDFMIYMVKIAALIVVLFSIGYVIFSGSDRQTSINKGTDAPLYLHNDSIKNQIDTNLRQDTFNDSK